MCLSSHLSFAASVGALAALAAAFLPVHAQNTLGRQTSPPNLAAVKTLYSEKCSACHNLPVPEEKGYTRREWQRTVDRMLNKYKASDSISSPEAAQIVDYLATFAPKTLKGGKPMDIWASDADDIWMVTPSASRVFNFASGSLNGLAPLAAGVPGPAPVWKIASLGSASYTNATTVHPAVSNPSRFALLMDRTDTGRNLDIKVRFQILKGQASPAAGIVFGFTGQKNYSVLRYDAAKNDLALLQIAEPAHTLLQETPLILADAPNNVPISHGWHTLRLLVRDGQVRGWLDMTKRISVTVPNYNGGKVGLWTQGDTVASFADWTVDLYDAPATPALPPAS